MSIELIRGDCLEIMAGMEPESVDTVITDSPYGLLFMGKEWDRGIPGIPFWAEMLRVAKPGAFLLAMGGRRTEHRLVCAIEDAGWEIVDKLAWIYGSGFPKSYNTSKNLTLAIPLDIRCACEQNGLDINSSSQSGYRPSGDLCDEQLHPEQDNVLDVFPSLDDVPEHIHDGRREDGLCIEQGHNPYHLSNDHLSIGDCVLLLEHLSRDSQSGGSKLSDTLKSMLHEVLTVSRKKAYHIYGTDDLASDSVSSLACASPPNNYVTSIYHKCPSCQMYYAVEGFGTALKPAIEGICVARKPLNENNCINALRHGVAGLNIDGARVGITGDDKRGEGGRNHQPRANTAIFGGATGSEMLPPSIGRWPANLIHDGSDQVVGLFPVTKSKATGPTPANEEPTNADVQVYGWANCPQLHKSGAHYGDTGSAARFFYCAKASRSERDAGLGGMEAKDTQSTGWSGDSMPLRQDGTERKMPQGRNTHPTVKPLALFEYLCTLTRTPTGGVVLDPFAGSGTTMVACVNTGRDGIGIDISEEYIAIAEKRVEHAQAQPRLM